MTPGAVALRSEQIGLDRDGLRLGLGLGACEQPAVRAVVVVTRRHAREGDARRVSQLVRGRVRSELAWFYGVSVKPRSAQVAPHALSFRAACVARA